MVIDVLVKEETKKFSILRRVDNYCFVQKDIDESHSEFVLTSEEREKNRQDATNSEMKCKTCKDNNEKLQAIMTRS